jgi:L-rhamnose mutarotase
MQKNINRVNYNYFLNKQKSILFIITTSPDQHKMCQTEHHKILQKA